MKIEFLKQHHRPLQGQAVQVKRTGNLLEVRYCPQAGLGCPIEKLDKDTFLELKTGEVREFTHHEKRTDDFQSLSRSLRRLRDLINCNVTSARNCKWVTLTYEENMKCQERLYNDFKAFNSKLRRWLKRDGKSGYEYIAVAEPQKRGAWHLHCFLMFESAAPFIHYSVIQKAWGQGAVDIRSLKNIDNVGAYLTPYLTDISLVEGLQDRNIKGVRKAVETDESGTQITKAYIKGGRLKYYPNGFRLYRASRGVKRPILFDCTEAEAMRMVGSARLTFEKTIRVSDDTGKTLNLINYRQFNTYLPTKKENEK